MKDIIKHIRTDKIIKWALYAAFFLLVLELITLAFSYHALPPYLPLFNQLTWGEERLGAKIEIFLPVLISLSFFVLNFVILARLYEKMPLLSRILAITTLLLIVLSAIFIIRTVYLVL